MHPFSESLGTMEVVSETSKKLAEMDVEVHIFTPYDGNKVNDNFFIHKLPSLVSKINLENKKNKK